MHVRSVYRINGTTIRYNICSAVALAAVASEKAMLVYIMRINVRLRPRRKRLWRIFSPGHGAINAPTKRKAIDDWIAENGPVDRIIRIGKILQASEAAMEEADRNMEAQKGKQ